MSAAAERSLFASKGRAAPVGAGATAEAEAADDAAAASAVPRQPEPVSNTATEAPAGSLLSFRLRSAPEKPALNEALKAALARPAPGAPAPEPVPEPGSAVAAEGNGQAAPAQAMQQAAVAASPPAAAAPAPIAPVPTPATAARIDTPLFPQVRREREAPLAARAPARHTPPPAPAWRTALPVGCAVLAIAAVGWLISRSDAPDAAVSPAMPVEAEPVPAAAGPQLPPAAAAPGETTEPSAVAEAAATQMAAAEAAVPPAVAEEMPMAAAPEPDPSVADASPAEAPLAIMPSFEVVRVAPDAPPVLAGRAAPGSELIVLDNGAMIGTARADANGEWAMVADAPLPAGRHELTLAVATPDGAVVVEQADVRADPAPEGTGDLPYPAHKPVAGSAAPTAYMVQLASVPSAADAEREWTRLQQAHAAQLGAAEAEIDAVELSGRGTFYRVRTGPFADRETARQLCSELDAAGQDCLVVRQEASE